MLFTTSYEHILVVNGPAGVHGVPAICRFLFTPCSTIQPWRQCVNATRPRGLSRCGYVTGLGGEMPASPTNTGQIVAASRLF